METQKPVRVAIVGSGMAGLVTAYLLRHDARQRYDVKLFESGKSLSLDSASVSLPHGSGATGSTDRVDLPMRAFAGGFYNNLKSMYDHLGIIYHSQPFLFEFAKVQASMGEGTDQSYFTFGSNLHKIPVPRLNAFATTSYILEAFYLLACYTWFSVCCFFVAPKTFANGRKDPVSETVEHYLRRIRLPHYFTTHYLLPLMSSVSTCPHQALLRFPASDLVEYKRRTHRAPHYTVSNGVKTVQERLVEGVDYQLSTIVTSVEPKGNQVEISWKHATDSDGAQTQEIFDRVVLAVTPDVVGNIFAPLRYHMARIPTMQVESVVHTDRRILSPGTNHNRTNAQLIYLRTSTDGTHRTESLHVQPCGAIVTTCPFSDIDSAQTIHRAKFTRVLRSPESRRIVNNIFEETYIPSHEEKALPTWRNGDNNVWLVGGWCWDGMVLLEGCVVSAMRVARAFDVEVPWLREDKFAETNV
ncbi:FAD/NAD(P)-binding domain-containing protein [Westerdykella ornata]|uniref:FAD/NAD(P)-binding domain-containing protein n=1 Tax=Westerdykella ornata TaxID=318751 RepID=A0A6A6JKU7_WESOR|nr:FAD/NAD(P)-binding domain-containing protein [Westerdykella ornata]KAF2277102.1 FAD/NAD(P)-binding domain-containing protein [Westerdykella ornata]